MTAPADAHNEKVPRAPNPKPTLSCDRVPVTTDDGWRFLTVDNLAPNGHADALLYEKALDAFDRAAGDHECRHRGRQHGLTFGIRADDAEQRIAWLRTRLEYLRPPALPGHGTWDIRDGAR